MMAIRERVARVEEMIFSQYITCFLDDSRSINSYFEIAFNEQISLSNSYSLVTSLGLVYKRKQLDKDRNNKGSNT